MNDLIVLVLTTAFFALTVAYVGLCDRIIGVDPEPDTTGTGRDTVDGGVEAETVTA